MFDVPNLDATDDEDLRMVATVFRKLAGYATRKASAIVYRKNGDIQEATRLERECETLYLQLPQWARW